MAFADGRMVELSVVRRVVTLNVRHGGGKRIDAICDRLVSYDADAIVVTEFRNAKTGFTLLRRLADAGYETAHAETPARENTVLIASKTGITRLAAPGDAPGSRHLLYVDVGWVTLCGAYFPVGAAKLPYWDALIADAPRIDAPELIIGDFNTGSNTLDKDPAGVTFVGAENLGLLEQAGYVDLWRASHPQDREYSWVSNPGQNGFRIDHAFALPRIAQRTVEVRYDQTPRFVNETDHAALVVTFR